MIQSNLPPRFEVGDTLYLRAAKSKPLLFITLLISENLLSKSLDLKLQKKFQTINMILKIYYLFYFSFKFFSLILTFEENLIKINSFQRASISNLFFTFSISTLLELNIL